MQKVPNEKKRLWFVSLGIGIDNMPKSIQPYPLIDSCRTK